MYGTKLSQLRSFKSQQSMMGFLLKNPHHGLVKSTTDGANMNKYLLYFIVILSLISCSVHAANTIQILTAKAGDTAELSQYLQKNINDDVKF
jgi:hypothetical protein